jgi:hypothetical protein
MPSTPPSGMILSLLFDATRNLLSGFKHSQFKFFALGKNMQKRAPAPLHGGQSLPDPYLPFPMFI